MAETFFTRDVHDLANQIFTASVMRMRLASENNLHREIRVIQDFLQPLRVAEQQRSPLVSGEIAAQSQSSAHQDSALHPPLQFH